MKEEPRINKTFILTGISLIVILLIAGVLLLPSSITGFSILGEKMTKVKIETSKGDIVVKLNPEKAPITVENFLNYVDSGFYDGLVFHRVIDGFMIQGGGYTKDAKEKQTNSPIKLESNNGLKNKRGTIAMARTNVPDSATSQFFINTVDNNFLDYTPFNPGYAVFGEVIEGMDVVDEISKVKTSSRGRMKDWPVEDVVIYKITRV